MDIAQEIGVKIRHYRKKKGMTVEQLADAVCKSKSSISKYESGQIVMDILSLYDIARALDVNVTQLMYLPPNGYTGASSGSVPAFFTNLSHFYMYYFDGRTNQVNRCVIDVASEIGTGVYHVHMYMNVKDFQHYTLCENLYEPAGAPESGYGDGSLSDRRPQPLHECPGEMGLVLWHFQPSPDAHLHQSAVVQDHSGGNAGI